MLYVAHSSCLESLDPETLESTAKINIDSQPYRVKRIPSPIFFRKDQQIHDETLLAVAGNSRRRGGRSCFVSVLNPETCLEKFSFTRTGMRNPAGLEVVPSTALDSISRIVVGGENQQIFVFGLDRQPRSSSSFAMKVPFTAVERLLYVREWPGNDLFVSGRHSATPGIAVADLQRGQVFASSLSWGPGSSNPWFQRTGYHGSVKGLAADVVRDRLFSAHQDSRCVSFSDIRNSGRRVGYCRVEGRPLTLFFAPDLNCLLIGCTGSVDVYDCRKGRLREFRIDMMGVEEFARIDRFTFAAATYGRGVGLFDIAKGVKQRGLRNARGCTGVCFVGDDFQNEAQDRDERLGFWIRMCREELCHRMVIDLVGTEQFYFPYCFVNR